MEANFDMATNNQSEPEQCRKPPNREHHPDNHSGLCLRSRLAQQNAFLRQSVLFQPFNGFAKSEIVDRAEGFPEKKLFMAVHRKYHYFSVAE